MKQLELMLKSIIVFLAICFSAGCGGDEASGRTVTIGVLNAETGALASTGSSMKIALEIAEQEVNQRLTSSNAGFNINLEFSDTQTSPEIALEKLQLFANKGIKFIIGPLSTAEAIALSDYSLQNDILLISPSSTAVSLAKSDDLIVRLPQNDRGHAMAITAALKYFGTSFYVPIWRADAFGDDLVKTVGERFEGAGGRFAPGARYDLDMTDFSEPLAQLEVQLDAFVDFFGLRSSAVYAVSFDEIWSLLSQASSRAELLRSVMWYGSDGIALNYGLFQDANAVQFMLDTRMISPIFAGDPTNQEFIDVRNEIETKQGEKVRPYAVLGYDAVLIIAEALKAIGSTEVGGAALKNKIIEISSDTAGASGNLALDENGDRLRGVFEFWKILRDSSGNPDWIRAGTFQSDLDAANGGAFIPE